MTERLPIRLIVGLGNPGRQYERTRHNAGFMALDHLAENLKIEFKIEPRWQALVARQGDLWLLKPQTFMNLSGQSVGKASRFLKFEPSQVLVAYDDVALPLGKLRFRLSGSAAGHNGMKSLISHLGTEMFPRLKIGIGESSGEALIGHVLGNFRAEEVPELEKVLASSAEALQVAHSKGVEAAANQFNSFKKT